MVKNGQVPDAWEDDWEAQADKAAAQGTPSPEPSAPLSKKERLAQHAELNRRIWETAYVAFQIRPRPSSSPVRLFR